MYCLRIGTSAAVCEHLGVPPLTSYTPKTNKKINKSELFRAGVSDSPVIECMSAALSK